MRLYTSLQSIIKTKSTTTKKSPYSFQIRHSTRTDWSRCSSSSDGRPIDNPGETDQWPGEHISTEEKGGRPLPRKSDKSNGSW